MTKQETETKRDRVRETRRERPRVRESERDICPYPNVIPGPVCACYFSRNLFIVAAAAPSASSFYFFPSVSFCLCLPLLFIFIFGPPFVPQFVWQNICCPGLLMASSHCSPESSPYLPLSFSLSLPICRSVSFPLSISKLSWQR